MRRRSSRFVAALACVPFALACSSRQAPAPLAARADSLVLERTVCFGMCPAYRLSVRADGRTMFATRTPSGSAGVVTDSVTPAQFVWLVQRAGRIGLAQLPPVIADDRTLCPVQATDHPTVTVSLFGDSTVTVVDYRGCYAGTDLSVAVPLAQLRHFEMQIDSVTRSQRWTNTMLR